MFGKIRKLFGADKVESRDERQPVSVNISGRLPDEKLKTSWLERAKARLAEIRAGVGSSAQEIMNNLHMPTAGVGVMPDEMGSGWTISSEDQGDLVSDSSIENEAGSFWKLEDESAEYYLGNFKGARMGAPGAMNGEANQVVLDEQGVTSGVMSVEYLQNGGQSVEPVSIGDPLGDSLEGSYDQPGHDLGERPLFDPSLPDETLPIEELLSPNDGITASTQNNNTSKPQRFNGVIVETDCTPVYKAIGASVVMALSVGFALQSVQDDSQTVLSSSMSMLAVSDNADALDTGSADIELTAGMDLSEDGWDEFFVDESAETDNDQANPEVVVSKIFAKWDEMRASLGDKAIDALLDGDQEIKVASNVQPDNKPVPVKIVKPVRKKRVVSDAKKEVVDFKVDVSKKVATNYSPSLNFDNNRGTYLAPTYTLSQKANLGTAHDYLGNLDAGFDFEAAHNAIHTGTGGTPTMADLADANSAFNSGWDF